jgi:hypothetical protein
MSNPRYAADHNTTLRQARGRHDAESDRAWADVYGTTQRRERGRKVMRCVNGQLVIVRQDGPGRTDKGRVAG